MDTVEQPLSDLGFACRRMRFGEIENLYARYGTDGPNLCFAGHTDVVPVGDAAAWSSGAFDAAERDGVLIGGGEGAPTHGTKMVVEALDLEDEVITHCVVGEPTSSETFGDMIKVGRRGSINA